MSGIPLLLKLLYPPKCVLCGRLLKGSETDLCSCCRRETPEYPKGKRKPQFLDSFTAVWYYEEYPRKSLLRFKFSGKGNYAPAYGRLLGMRLLKDHPEGFDCLTWVPVSSLRRFLRGYDQGELIARAVARELDIPAVALLKKTVHNRAQSGIADAAQRRANVLGVYRILSPEQIPDKRILLVDDILASGATAGECARMLRIAGAKEVHCAAMAAPRK